jgi:hypothetical protein
MKFRTFTSLEWSQGLFTPCIFILAFALSITAGLQSAHAGPFDDCNKNLKIRDGRYNFVWKPTGAHRPQSVLVLPERFKGFVPGSGGRTTVVRSVTLYRASDEQRIGTMPMKSTGICPFPEFPECLNRPTFAHQSLSGRTLSRRHGQIRLKVVTNGLNNRYCSTAFDPAVRQD